MERKQIPGCWPILKLSVRFSHYAIIDTEHYLADQLFIKHKVRVWFGHEFKSPDSPYVVIFCKCRKRDAKRFEDAMEELSNKMLLCGHPDYITYSETLRRNMEHIRENGGEVPNEAARPSA